jgi:50S ribosomal subunit-associated GTPase HflX
MNNEIDIESNILNKLILDHDIKDIVFISAVDKRYKDLVLDPLIKRLEYSNELSIDLPNKPLSQSFINWLYTNCEIISIEYDDSIKIHLKCRDRDKDHITINCNKLKGNIYENNHLEI